MGMLPQKEKKYKDGRTKQSFKDECDINKILKRAQKTGTVSHLARRGPEYGDYSDFDFFEAQTKLAKASEIFDELPSEVRREFGHNAGAFFEYVNDPANVDRLKTLLPKIAEPGSSGLLQPVRTAEAMIEPEAGEVEKATEGTEVKE